LPILLLALFAAAPAHGSATERTAAAHITAAEISGHIRFLADDLLEGRKPGTRGADLAVKYIATEMESMGLSPGATAQDGSPSWFQSVPLVELRGRLPREMVFRGPGGDLSLSIGQGVKSDLRIDPDAHVEVARVPESDLVFAGYGIVAPEYGWDDYKNVDVRGKIVVLMNFNPPFQGEGKRLWYGRWDYKYLTAAAHGAAGAIIIHTTPSAGYPWQVVVTSWSTPHQNLPPAPEDKFMEFQGWMTEPAAIKLAELGGKDLDQLRKSAESKDFRPVPLGSTLSLEMPVQIRTIRSANVVGILPGTDPRLRDEAILYTAHHDHLGRVQPIPPATDGIYNGALDNASGCATVLSIARAITFAPPKRSVIVAFVTAEEQGLLGSKFLAH